jgi:hypothetical protein
MAAMWTFALARLAGILMLGLCFGLLIGPIWLWMLAAACLYLGWQLVNLYRLDRWLRLRSQIDPPNHRRHLGRYHRPGGAPAPAQAVPQAAPGAAVTANCAAPRRRCPTASSS